MTKLLVTRRLPGGFVALRRAIFVYNTGFAEKQPYRKFAKVAELVDALDLGSCGATRESSSLSFRTIIHFRLVGQLQLSEIINASNG